MASSSLLLILLLLSRVLPVIPTSPISIVGAGFAPLPPLSPSLTITEGAGPSLLFPNEPSNLPSALLLHAGSFIRQQPPLAAPAAATNLRLLRPPGPLT